MGKNQHPTPGSSKADKNTHWRFSPAAKSFLRDYYRNTNKTPKKAEREGILAHLKGIGDTEVTDARLVNWFTYSRREERRHSTETSHPLPTSPPDQPENKWVDAHHETLWPSLTVETLNLLEGLYDHHITQPVTGDPPYDHWAEGLEAKPVHVRMWCKAKERQFKRKSCPDTSQMAEGPSQTTEERSQLPTPGNSTSPEPRTTSATWAPSPPDAVKDEPPVSPVVETTQFQQPPATPKESSSMGLHEAIESAFSRPLHPPPSTTPPSKPLSTAGPNRKRKPSSRSSLKALQIVPPPTPPSISAIGTNSASTSRPPTSIVSPSQSAPFSHPPLCESPASLLPEHPISEPPKRPERDIARERAAFVAGVAQKLHEANALSDSTRGATQYGGNIQEISRRNKQFLSDVSAGRFSHMRLTSTHVQLESSLPEYNPLRVLAERRDGKGKRKEKATEDDMEVD